MVHLMLDANGKQTFRVQREQLATLVQGLHRHALRPGNPFIDAGNRKAPLLALRLAARRHNFRIDENPEFITVFGQVHHDNLLVDIHLSGGKADSRRRIHRFSHIPHQSAYFFIDFGDGRGHFVEPLVGILKDLKLSHKKLANLINYMQNLNQRVNGGSIFRGPPGAAINPQGTETSMRKTILSLILLFGFVVAAIAATSQGELKTDAPDRYTIVKGDTLWGISKRFLTDPWKWPELWGLNREQIRNPHLIYPDQVLVLDRRGDGTARLTVSGVQTVKLSPTIRVEPSAREAIPSVAPGVIEPFLSKPLVVEQGAYEKAPTIVAGPDQRVIFGTGDDVYAIGVTEKAGQVWHVYREGRALIDPDTKENLGSEAIYLGDAKVRNFGKVSKLEIVTSNQEINANDALSPSPGLVLSTYAPHAPEKEITGRIMSAYGGLAEVGQNSIVTINRGARDGLEKGHVLAVYRDGETIKTKVGKVTLPGDRIGLVFVFRVFNRVAYALVVESAKPIHVKDVVTKP